MNYLYPFGRIVCHGDILYTVGIWISISYDDWTALVLLFICFTDHWLRNFLVSSSHQFIGSVPVSDVVWCVGLHALSVMVVMSVDVPVSFTLALGIASTAISTVSVWVLVLVSTVVVSVGASLRLGVGEVVVGSGGDGHSSSTGVGQSVAGSFPSCVFSLTCIMLPPSSTWNHVHGDPLLIRAITTKLIVKQRFGLLCLLPGLPDRGWRWLYRFLCCQG